MKKLLPFLLIVGFLFTPQAFADPGERCAGPAADCCEENQATIQGGGCTNGQVFIGTEGFGYCQDPVVCNVGQEFQCSTNTCYTPPAAAVCSSSNVNTGSGIPCCAEGQIVVRGASNNWVCSDNAAGLWSTNASDVYYAGGNVGIGTSSPGDLLEVDGSATVDGRMTVLNPDNNDNSVSLSWSNDVARIRVGGNGAGASNGLDIQTTGNESLLRVNHSNDNVPILEVNRDSGYPSISSNSDAAGGWMIVDGRLSDDGNVGLNHYSSGNVILANGGGKVGIGTSSPSELLTVAGRMKIDASNAGLWIEAGSNDWFVGRSGSNLRFYNSGDRITITPDGNVSIDGHTIGTSYASYGGGIRGGSTSSPGSWEGYFDDDVYVKDQLRVDDDIEVRDNLLAWDNVYVNSNYTGGGYLYVRSEDNNQSTLSLYTDAAGTDGDEGVRLEFDEADGRFYIKVSSPSDNGHDYGDGGTTPALRTAITIDEATRRVGIGDTTPNYLLDVEDTHRDGHVVFFRNKSTNSNADILELRGGPNYNPGTGNNFISFRDGDGTTVGQIDGNGSGAVRYTNGSDRRIKTNISDYNGALDTLMDTRPVRFSYKSAPDKENIGFIAQELLEVYPYSVTGSPDDDPEVEPMGIDYGSITPLLTRSIQELKTEKDDEISALKKENQVLREALCTLDSNFNFCSN